MRLFAVLLAASLVVVACATPDEATEAGIGVTSTTTATTTTTGVETTTSTTPPPTEFALPFCTDLSWPTAPGDWYRGVPQYVGNEMPIEAVQEFASGLPGFEVIWIDRLHNGWLTVGFHGTDVEARQADLIAEFPGVGVVAVAMPYGRIELAAIRIRIHEALPEGMDAMNVLEVPGAVEVWVGDLTEERVAQVVEVAGDDPVCINGWLPGFLPPEGPQLDGGDGWRYLGEVDAWMGSDATPRVATDAAAWSALWAEFGHGDEPTVDFEVEIAVALEIGRSSSCPETRLDGVIVEGKLLYPQIAHTSRERACTADYNPRIYFFTVARDRLPAPPFHLVSRREARQATRVDADLSEPGSTLRAVDVRSVSVTPPRTATIFPLIVETGYPWTFILQLSCGVERLGEVNAYSWRTDTDVVPPAWVEAAHGGLIELDLLLQEGSPPVLTLSGYGVTLEYRIVEGPPPECG